MIFNRFNLIKAICKAKIISNNFICTGLISIWYRLIDQESINGKLINDFYYYGEILDEAIFFYEKIKKESY